MRPIMITDRRILSSATSDALARSTFRWRPLFVFKGGDYAIAVYVFGKAIYKKGWLI